MCLLHRQLSSIEDDRRRRKKEEEEKEEELRGGDTPFRPRYVQTLEAKHQHHFKDRREII